MTRRKNPQVDWSAKAARVGELLPPSRLHPAALAWTAKRRKTEFWAVALSGGVDSLALLLLLRAHFPKRKLVALHFNHRLRGRAAGSDAAFCARVCRKLGVRCLVGVWRTAPQAASESEARLARHEFFRGAMRKMRTKTLWLAHQQDDIAESMLMRLARGSGTGGLAAPRPVQLMGDGRVHLRPLLTLKKAELVAALRRAGVKWREDASNAGNDHFRNRIRQSVLPAWAKAAGRDALAGAALSRELLEDDDDALEAWLDEIKPLDRLGRLNLDRLKGKPLALMRRALHRWLLFVRPETDLSRQGFNQLLAAVKRGRDTRFSLGARGFAVVRRAQLKFQRS